MGYVVPDIIAAKNYVIASAVALFLTFAVHYDWSRSTTYANLLQYASMNLDQSHKI